MRLDEIYTLCLQHHFSPDAAAIMAAIALAESGGNPNSECHSCAGVPENSIGLYQINMDFWSDQFPPQCALDPACATGAAYIISNGGTNFAAWSTYNNGRYKQYYVPHGNIVTQSGQAVDTNPALKVTHALGDSGAGQAVKNAAGKGSDLTNKIKDALGLNASVSPDELKNALIAVTLIAIAGLLVGAGIFGLAANKAAPEIIKVAGTAAKVGAL